MIERLWDASWRGRDLSMTSPEPADHGDRHRPLEAWTAPLNERRLRVGMIVGAGLAVVGLGTLLVGGWWGWREYQRDAWIVHHGDRTTASVVSAEGDYRRVEFRDADGQLHRVTVVSDEDVSVAIAFDPKSPDDAVSLSDPYDRVFGWGALVGAGVGLLAAGAVVIRGRRASLGNDVRIGDADGRVPTRKVLKLLTSTAEHAELRSGPQGHDDDLFAWDIIVAAELLHQRGVALFSIDRRCVGAVDHHEDADARARVRHGWRSVIDRTGHVEQARWTTEATSRRKRDTNLGADIVDGSSGRMIGRLERAGAESGALWSVAGFEIVEVGFLTGHSFRVVFARPGVDGDPWPAPTVLEAVAVIVHRGAYVGRAWRAAWAVAFAPTTHPHVRALVLASLACPRPIRWPRTAVQ
jgi:hypothetical protein